MLRNIVDHANQKASIGCTRLIYKTIAISKTSNTIVHYIYANTAFDNQVSPLFCAQIFHTVYLFALLLNKKRTKNNQASFFTTAFSKTNGTVFNYFS